MTPLKSPWYLCLIASLLSSATFEATLEAAPSPSDEPTIAELRVGFNGAYKLGCWTPVEIELTGGAKQFTGRLAITVPDSDGVPTTVVSAEDRPVGVQPGQTTSARLLVRVGQSNATWLVRFLAEGQVLAERKFYSGPEQDTGAVPGGVPATNRLLLEFGPTVGLGELVRAQDSNNEQTATKIIHVEQTAELPTDWIGFEGIDTVLLATSEPERYRPLLQNSTRVESLRRWVELGGRLVVFCGSEAEELLADDGVLAELIPGKFAEMVPLRQWQALESYSGAERPKTNGGRLDLRIPKLENVQGHIMANAGSLENALPLVVRSRLGLGELVFVALDFDRPPLRDWEGRTSFLRKVLNWSSSEGELRQADKTLASVDSDDMIGKLRVALDNQFAGVEVVPFAVVALFVVVYILLIGPGDYLFVSRLLKRPELTWVTFPLIVIGVSAAAYWYANWKKGDQLRINQVEVVDFDLESGLARGTVWSHFFTPRVDDYDLTLQPRYLASPIANHLQSQVSWLGLPGYALGGMQGSAAQTAAFSQGYSFTPNLAGMKSVPVQVWSTKTISARWSAQVDSPIAPSLYRTGDELLGGELSNLSGMGLDDCLLLHGNWAYYLGPMADGVSVKLDHTVQPRTVKTSLTSATAGDTTETDTADDGTVSFRSAESDVTRLVKVMMFFDAIDGRRYTGKLHRYQSFLDMSHLLRQKELAILLARIRQPGSQWLNSDQPFQSDDDKHWTFYRFVVPVGTAPSP